MNTRFIFHRIVFYFVVSSIVMFVTDWFLFKELNGSSLIKRNYLTVILITIAFTFLDYRKAIRKNSN